MNFKINKLNTLLITKNNYSLLKMLLNNSINNNLILLKYLKINGGKYLVTALKALKMYLRSEYQNIFKIYQK